MIIDDEAVVLDILDTAGQEEYGTMQDQWFRFGHGFLIVYSVTQRKGFEDVPKIRDKIVQIQEEVSGPDVPIVIVGNKCDLEEERLISYEDGFNLAKGYGYPFFETSAKAHIHVEDCFSELVREVRRKRGFGSDKDKQQQQQSVDGSQEGIVHKKNKKSKHCIIL